MWDLYLRRFRARVWAVRSVNLCDCVVLEEVEEGVWIHLRCVSLSRNFRCCRNGYVIVLWEVPRFCIDVLEFVVDVATSWRLSRNNWLMPLLSFPRKAGHAMINLCRDSSCDVSPPCHAGISEGQTCPECPVRRAACVSLLLC